MGSAADLCGGATLVKLIACLLIGLAGFLTLQLADVGWQVVRKRIHLTAQSNKYNRFVAETKLVPVIKNIHTCNWGKHESIQQMNILFLACAIAAVCEAADDHGMG